MKSKIVNGTLCIPGNWRAERLTVLYLWIVLGEFPETFIWGLGPIDFLSETRFKRAPGGQSWQ
jgi:hypothetical protein